MFSEIESFLPDFFLTKRHNEQGLGALGWFNADITCLHSLPVLDPMILSITYFHSLPLTLPTLAWFHFLPPIDSYASFHH